MHALVGENGAGKSTLIKIVTGAERPDAGDVRVAGPRRSGTWSRPAHALGIAAIYQQPALFPDLTVAENIALASNRRRVAARPVARTGRTCAYLAGASRHALDPARLVDTLWMPEQQLVEIAKALGGDARILILDEPSASLTEREAERCLTVRPCSARGRRRHDLHSHRLDEVFAIADRVTVLRDGNSSGTLRRAEAHAADSSAHGGRELSTLSEGDQCRSARRASRSASLT